MSPAPYRPYPETDTLPTQQRLLGELLISNLYQIEADGHSFADHIERLRDSEAAYERGDASPDLNPKRGGSRPIVSATPGAVSERTRMGDF